MSTIRADNYEDRLGNRLAKIRAYAYINAETGTVVERKKFGLDGVTDNGVGDFTLRFNPAMPTTDYVMVSSSAHRNGATAMVENTNTFSQTINAKRFLVQYVASLSGGATHIDINEIQVAIISDL
jgi:hypothetical protein